MSDHGPEHPEHVPHPHPDKQREITGLLQMWKGEDLVAAIACVRPETWFADLLRTELVSRGLGHKGEWVGVEAAAKVWRRP